MALIYFVMPLNFPYGPPIPAPGSQPSVRHRLRRIDFIGVFLMLAASILLVTGLLEASSTTFKWSSPTIIVLIILAGILWSSFFLWEWWLSTRREGKTEDTETNSVEAIFLARFWRNRVWMSVLM